MRMTEIVFMNYEESQEMFQDRCVRCDSILNNGRCPGCGFDINDFPRDEIYLRDSLEKLKQQITSAPTLVTGFLLALKWAYTMLNDYEESEKLLVQAEESCETITDYCDVAKSYHLYFDHHEKTGILLNHARELANTSDELQYIADVCDAAGIVGL